MEKRDVGKRAASLKLMTFVFPMPPNHRRCVSCRKLAPKDSFWRVVRVFPTGTVQLDQGAGRSAYLCPQISCLQMAQKKNRLGRSLKAIISPEVYRLLEQRLSTGMDMIAEGGSSGDTSEKSLKLDEG